MKNFVFSLVRDEQGQDLIEYALLAGLISILCVAAIRTAGSKVSSLFSSVSVAIP
jgi:pilus assembly protein Flp/PilA